MSIYNERYRVEKQCYICGVGIGRAEYYDKDSEEWIEYELVYQDTNRFRLKHRFRSVCLDCAPILDKLINKGVDIEKYIKKIFVYPTKKKKVIV